MQHNKTIAEPAPGNGRTDPAGCEPASPLARAFRHWQADGRAGRSTPIAEDPATRALFALATRAAQTGTTILITGPSGTGKEVMARHIHAASPRAAGTFIALNCAALPEAMLEALLFGHERGAFTGAQGSAPGLFRAASGGTLFLDELGELPLSLQSKLLRAVEQREVLPLGATAPVAIDARILAATNRDLPADVAAGRFRADLYWRLAVFPIALPPLAGRPMDILPLAAALLARIGAHDAVLTETALSRLQHHPWPGNVRELANVLERARILAGDAPIATAHIQFDSLHNPSEPRGAELADPPSITLPATRRSSEAEAIRMALAQSGGRKATAARHLGISERTLRYKLAAMAGRSRTTRTGHQGAPAGMPLPGTLLQ